MNEKCKLCKYRVECLESIKDCQITNIDDEPRDDLLPHPSEIEFDLKAPFAKLIGNQLLVWVDEKTIRALASMRDISLIDYTAGFDHLVSAHLDHTSEVSLCFLPWLPEEEAARNGITFINCTKCGNRIGIKSKPDSLEDHPCPNCLTTLPIQRNLFMEDEL